MIRINTHHAEQFAYYLGRLAATPDGDGSLLDHVVLYYGAGMSEGDHQPWNLPLVVAGGGGGRLNGGRHLRYDGGTGGGRSVAGGTPLANLHLTVAEKLGMRLDSLHDSTGRLDL
ncbi:MAG: hypothetical protein J4G16_15420 [Acidobacteria bacterium]|nr:hypothetical protein [Acidobacteriota bacterium]